MLPFFSRLRPSRRLVLFCDYAAESPVWRARKPRPMVALESLPLSAATKEALRAWQAGYEESPEEAAHDAEGERLWRIVQRELGPGWKVGFLPEEEEDARVRW